MARPTITTSYSARPNKNYLLTEFFGRLLQENGSGILLENSVNNLYTTRTKISTNYT